MTNENESAQSMVLGDVEVIRVVEPHEPFQSTSVMFPTVAADVWKDNEDWLAPDHWEPDTDRPVTALQTWVLRSGGRTILVDTGAGDGRERPGMGPFHQARSDLPGLLARAGVRPQDVDVVVNTHLHVDHVGWNTVDADGQWVPTFPNAQYLIPAADDFHYGPDNAYGNGVQKVDRLIYEDSIAPIHQAGQAVLWDGLHRIDEHLTLESAPGHTPGSSVLRLASGSDRAVFVGDLLHSPVQILQPCCNSNACLAPEQAVASRRRILGRAADERELLIPAHFGGAGAVEVRREGDGFALGAWATANPKKTTSVSE
ncbi:MBL fold metallo-hydrolase [Actinoallomurus sp. NBC_01490]|jgi:glyoxylase-like metal-dependent hydrolase (beta-lactamase superfamily II)|uniref:MBL fold metallo-hydrolase n=1 Tax=Actinoallomurus sp. NBC_01490 TaxID=2903557 RepID=UPI002E3070D8|nr:MBL fold metallo-hydrolase [Actinoallomurus sp. NBC_01490]